MLKLCKTNNVKNKKRKKKFVIKLLSLCNHIVPMSKNKINSPAFI